MKESAMDSSLHAAHQGSTLHTDPALLLQSWRRWGVFSEAGLPHAGWASWLQNRIGTKRSQAGSPWYSLISFLLSCLAHQVSQSLHSSYGRARAQQSQSQHLALPAAVFRELGIGIPALAAGRHNPRRLSSAHRGAGCL